MRVGIFSTFIDKISLKKVKNFNSERSNGPLDKILPETISPGGLTP